jgi:hypothetical protein
MATRLDEEIDMFLREYLYVDTAAVRGVLAQIDSGITEEETQAASTEKKTGGGVKGFAEHAQTWGENTATTKSFGDALFPSLESALEAEGYLEDISEYLAHSSVWTDDSIPHFLPPGRIVRLSAPGYLIDARFIASLLSGFAVTHRGLVNMGILEDTVLAPVPPKAKQVQKGKGYKELPGEAEGLESQIPIGKLSFDGEDGISGEFLRGITQVARGIFAPGLHLALVPEAPGAGAITVRLQEGRQFLDTDPDILFARYGVGSQAWTVVGPIGHHPLPDPDMSDAQFTDGDAGIVHRAAFGRYINQLGTMLGNLGFTDLPQAPGFSIVPWAVYRTIGMPE